MEETKKPRILIVNDNDSELRLMKALLLKNEGYVFETAGNGPEAIGKAGSFMPDLILLDILMPEMDGFEVCRKLKENPETRYIPVVFVTVLEDKETRLHGLECGAVDFITKPIDRIEFKMRVRNILKIKEFEDFLKQHAEILRKEVDRQTRRLQEAVEKLQKTTEDVIQMMAKMSEIRDPYTSGHQRKVAELAEAIAVELGLDKDTAKSILMTGIIHDVGKIAIPIELLTKPGKLTDMVFEIIKTHCREGADLVKGFDLPWPVADILIQHHERLNGSGYPEGLKGDAIRIEARILAVADVVEAMSSHRPYRPALGVERAMKEIKENKNVLYDPEVVDACEKVIRKGTIRLNS